MTSSTRRRRRSRKRAADARHDHVGAGDVRVENVPDPSIVAPTDAIIRVVRACICGSDLWTYNVLELTGGYGVHSVLECVGTGDSTLTAVEIARPGGAVGRVGVPHYEAIPAAQPTCFCGARFQLALSSTN